MPSAKLRLPERIAEDRDWRAGGSASSDGPKKRPSTGRALKSEKKFALAPTTLRSRVARPVPTASWSSLMAATWEKERVSRARSR
jgi:hypothetical protein